MPLSRPFPFPLSSFLLNLKNWFLANKRDVPWRTDPSPYMVWVSEVMLQQTRAEVVVPYFLHWMEKYPTVYALAKAPVDEVIKSWEGLGYYSRARNLYAGACYVVAHHGGQLPNDEQELKNIKGLGPYTIGAIRSFAFHEKAAAVDGNVMRVLTRLFAIDDDLAKPSTVRRLRQIAESLLPDREPWVIAEALIELGALICTPKPKCLKCPLRKNCGANKQQIADKLPNKSVKMKVTPLYRQVAIIRWGNQFLIKRTPKGEVMSDLHEFPYFETTAQGMTKKELMEQVFQSFGLTVQREQSLPEVTHTFTRYRARLRPILFSCKERREIKNFRWETQDSLQKLAFSSGHKRILEMIE